MIKQIEYKVGTVLICVFLMMGVFTPTAKAISLLHFGSKGNQVVEVQKYLSQLNYLSVRPTGYFGKLTKEAVKAFQAEHNLAVDGVVGPMTIDALREAADSSNRIVEYTVKPGDELETIATKYNTNIAVIMARNNLPDKQVSEGQKILIPIGRNHNVNSRNRPGGIQTLSWSIVNQLWRNGEIARIVDLKTGKSFLAKRLYGYYHADIEPLTKADTGVMKEIYSGKWSWDRRAVVIQVRNIIIAASINGMPHGGQSIYDNNFDGQFCAHFFGSRVHKTGRVDPEHQAMIKQAGRGNLFGDDHNDRKFVPIMTELEEAKTNHPRF